jgi:putative selenium metabolism hydrolase
MTTDLAHAAHPPAATSPLDRAIAALAHRDRPHAARLLRELIRVPADLVARSAADGGDPLCGLSNHEGPRLELLRRRLVDLRAVRHASDAAFDAFGNLVWTVQDDGDGIPIARKRVVLLDGHTDTVQALRDEWRARLGDGLDAYDGLIDAARVDRDALREAAGHLPPESEWEHLVFGRGAADQLAGVVCQVMATRILLELKGEGALRGVIVRSYATVAEEDNDGGGALFLKAHAWPGAPAAQIPDVVVLTEATGHAREGALGIYRGQRGRMQIEVRVTGRSCHGSMPQEGLNPLEHGAAIIVEAARAHAAGEGFADHPFLGRGSRTASWARVETPSDCAVPETLTLRLDRRLTVGESAEQALAQMDALEAVGRARAAGLRVEIGIPHYRALTWKGWPADNPQVYPGWLTPEDHPAVQAALLAYRGVVTPHVGGGAPYAGDLPREPRLGRWIFSTDGVGYPMAADESRIAVPEGKRWVISGTVRHPAMIGIGPGHEQNAHRIGENVDLREVVHATALLARFPSALVAQAGL